MRHYSFPFIFFLNFVLAPLSEIIEPFFGRYDFIYSYTGYSVVVISFLLTLPYLSRYAIKINSAFFITLSFIIIYLLIVVSLNQNPSSIATLFSFLLFFYFFYFGYSLPDEYLIHKYFSRFLFFAVFLLFGFTLLYLYLFYNGLLNRVGYSNPIGMAFSFFFFKNASISTLFVIILFFLSIGKRFEIIPIIILAGYFIYSRPRYLFHVIFSISLVFFIFVSSGFFDRWPINNSIDFNDITSGRFNEIVYISKLIISEPWSIFFGLSNAAILQFISDFGKLTVHNGIFFLIMHLGFFVSSVLLYLFVRSIFYDIKRYGLNFVNFYCLIYLISMFFSTAFISNMLFSISLGILYSNRSFKLS